MEEEVNDGYLDLGQLNYKDITTKTGVYAISERQSDILKHFKGIIEDSTYEELSSKYEDNCGEAIIFEINKDGFVVSPKRSNE